jgi:hypothetical protein
LGKAHGLGQFIFRTFKKNSWLVQSFCGSTDRCLRNPPTLALTILKIDRCNYVMLIGTGENPAESGISPKAFDRYKYDRPAYFINLQCSRSGDPCHHSNWFGIVGTSSKRAAVVYRIHQSLLGICGCASRNFPSRCNQLKPLLVHLSRRSWWTFCQSVRYTIRTIVELYRQRSIY